MVETELFPTLQTYSVHCKLLIANVSKRVNKDAYNIKTALQGKEENENCITVLKSFTVLLYCNIKEFSPFLLDQQIAQIRSALLLLTSSPILKMTGMRPSLK